jgi:hypothetical protein
VAASVTCPRGSANRGGATIPAAQSANSPSGISCQFIAHLPQWTTKNTSVTVSVVLLAEPSGTAGQGRGGAGAATGGPGTLEATSSLGLASRCVCLCVLR